MAKINLTDISSGYISTSTFNANNTLLEAAIENTLSRDGTTPNAMEGNLNMDSFRITNLVKAVNNTEPVILSQANLLAGVTNALTQNTVGDVLYPDTADETAAGATVVNSYIEPGNVLRYGTNSSPGTTDMTTAIQAAINVSELGKGVVIVPAGTFLTTAKLSTERYIKIIGAGMHSTIIRGNSNFDVLELAYSTIVREVLIADMSIESTASSGTGRGIYMDNPARVTCRNVRFDGHQGKGVFVDRNTDFNFMISFYDCWWNNNVDWGLDIDNGNAVNCYNCSWQDNGGELRFDGSYINVFGGYIGGTNATSGGACEIAGASGSPGVSGGGLWGVGFENNGNADAHLYLGSINTVKGFGVRNCFFTNPSAQSGAISCIKLKNVKDLEISGGDFLKSGSYTGTVVGVEFAASGIDDGGVSIRKIRFTGLDTDILNTGSVSYIHETELETKHVGVIFDSSQDTSGNTLGYSQHIYRDITDRATSGTGEDTLGTVTIAAGDFPAKGGLRIRAAGIKTNGAADGKTIKVYVNGGVETVISAVTTDTDWRFELDMINVSAAVNRFSWLAHDGVTPTQNYSVKAVNTAASMDVKLTGEVGDTGVDVITQKMFTVEMI